MRVFALSDIHVDYEVNAEWVAGISLCDYRDDVLILAGDVTATLRLLDWCLTALAVRFKKVLFVPGNHDLWVVREGRENTAEVSRSSVGCGIYRCFDAHVSTARCVNRSTFRVVRLFVWRAQRRAPPFAMRRCIAPTRCLPGARWLTARPRIEDVNTALTRLAACNMDSG